MLSSEATNRRLTSYCSIGETENLIHQINKLIEQHKKESIQLKNENRIYRESITSISHDIRTPLTSSKGYLQMLQKDEISQEKREEYLKIVECRLDSLTDMLNQLFEYARIEAGEMQLEPELINAGNLFAETIFMFYEDFSSRNFEPKVCITEKPCMIMADKRAYVRIIENLMKNALVHGKGDFSFSLEEENGQCVIKISNQTNTVEMGDIDRIFDRFYTTDQSRTKKTTGLGLAIVKRFATQMGGDARAYLKKERFTIEVSFPLVRESIKALSNEG